MIKMFAGIDIGSSSTDLVIIDSHSNIVASFVIETFANHKVSVDKIMNLAFQQLKCRREDIIHSVSTGYGRKNLDFVTKNVTEISCHAKGASFLFPSARTVLDIGGQDCKAIKIDSRGNVIDFFMNEKCAAGTGRFLEAMSRILHVNVEDLGSLSLNSCKDVKLSSVCAVFAESEVISKIAEEVAIEDIVNGIHDSVCKKVIGMLERVRFGPDVVLTGGVANNIGVVSNLEKMLKQKILRPDNPQIIGALGAALFASEI